MKLHIIALGLMIGLASCQTTSIDNTIKQALPQICGAAATSYAVLKPFIDAGKLKPKTVDAVNAAHDSLFGVEGDTASQALALCNNTNSATLASVLVAASTAALTISTAVKEAKHTEGTN